MQNPMPPSAQQQATQVSSFAAGGFSPADGCCQQPQQLSAQAQQQLQLTRSGSSGSAGTIVAAPSAGSPTPSPADYTLSSTLSSRLRDSCPGHVSTAGAEPATAGAMLPPRPVRLLQQRRTWQQVGEPVGSEDSETSPPPCKLRRTAEPAHMPSMARTKSVPLGLDQVLLEAMGGNQPAASC